jgi:hypothetical protein
MSTFTLLQRFPPRPIQNSDLKKGRHVWPMGITISTFTLHNHEVVGTDKHNWQTLEFVRNHPEIFQPNNSNQ